MHSPAVTPLPMTRAMIAACAALCVTASASAQSLARPFLFAQDSRTARPMRVLGSYRLTWGSSGGALRPIGANALGAPGFLHEFGGEFGLGDRFSLRVYGLVVDPATSATGGAVQGTAGGELRARVLGDVDGPHQLTVGLGVLREFGGDVAFQARVAGTMQFGALRLAGNLVLERSTRGDADGIDVIVVAGASYAVTRWLRFGAEYVGQDLEAAWDPEEREGVRHLAGPTVSLFSERAGLQFVGGPAFGLNRDSPDVVVRAGLSYGF